MRTRTLAISTTLCIALLAPASTASETLEPRDSLVLGSYPLNAGESVFWDGEYFEHFKPTGPFEIWVFQANDPVEYCNIPGYVTCLDYEIEVLEEAARLRVELDVRGPDFGPPTSDDYDAFRLEVLAPDGTLFDTGGTTYNEQIFVPDPVLGTWKVRVTPYRVTQGSFVMRAKLESELHRIEGSERLLPNLRSIPAFDFGTTGAIGYQCGVTGQCVKAEVGGRALFSCMPEEQVEEGATRCLRFAAGSENSGLGPLDMVFTPFEHGETARVTQVIHNADGTTTERDAGTVVWHKTHAHYHLSMYADFELLEVVREKKKGLVGVATGKKNGFCLGDERISDWEVFTEPPPPNDERVQDCFNPLDGQMVQNAGWGDIYEYNRGGNYVPMPMEDGDYVLRSTVDAANAILESDERDNVSYAWIRIEGGEIEFLEHGYGADPWDPHKVISAR